MATFEKKTEIIRGQYRNDNLRHVISFHEWLDREICSASSFHRGVLLSLMCDDGKFKPDTITRAQFNLLQAAGNYEILLLKIRRETTEEIAE